MAVGVDLDQNRHVIAGVAGVGGHGLCLFDAVEDDGEIDAARADGGDAGELIGSDADAVNNVAHAAFSEVFGLAERRHHGRALRAHHGDAGDVQGFGRLEVRAKPHAETGQMSLHPVDVGAEPGFVEKQTRRLQGVGRPSVILHRRTPSLARFRGGPR